jgi:hypothetical protein
MINQIVIPAGSRPKACRDKLWPESRSISSLDPGQKPAGVTG